MKVLHVVWNDASYTRDDVTPETVSDDLIVDTVGFLIKETPTTLHLSQQYVGANDVYQHTMHIPKLYVLRKKIVGKVDLE